MQMLIKNAKLRDREELVDIRIDGGRILDVAPGLAGGADTVLDAGGNLTTPSFVDPHIHLDKVNVLDSVRKNRTGTLKEAIEILWDRKRNYTADDVVARGSDVVEKEIGNGTLNIRTHIDVDTVTGLRALEGVMALREKYRGIVDIQTVAFPQEGLVRDPGADRLMERAMEAGCDLVGGMPAAESCPEDSRAHVRFCFDLAEKHDADIDMHVDESDDPACRTLEMVADETIRRHYEGRVTAGHTCALAAYDDAYAARVIEKVARARIRVITNPVTNLMLQGRHDRQPVRRGITRVKELLNAGVIMSFGQDCVSDTFYPYGSGDMLQVALITGHAAQLSLPDEIDRTFDMITVSAAEILKLENYGIGRGCRANLTVTACGNVRDAIRLTPARLYVIREGRVVARTVRDTVLSF